MCAISADQIAVLITAAGRVDFPGNRDEPGLMTQPKLLMLDEATAGVSPIVMDELFDRIIEIARSGISILMVEQNRLP